MKKYAKWVVVSIIGAIVFLLKIFFTRPKSTTLERSLNREDELEANKERIKGDISVLAEKETKLKEQLTQVESTSTKIDEAIANEEGDENWHINK